jgi:hypothetical protein
VSDNKYRCIFSKDRCTISGASSLKYRKHARKSFGVYLQARARYEPQHPTDQKPHEEEDKHRTPSTSIGCEGAPMLHWTRAGRWPLQTRPQHVEQASVPPTAPAPSAECHTENKHVVMTPVQRRRTNNTKRELTEVAKKAGSSSDGIRNSAARCRAGATMASDGMDVGHGLPQTCVHTPDR